MENRPKDGRVYVNTPWYLSDNLKLLAMKLWKISGTLLTATGIIHTVVGLVSGWNTYKEFFHDGLINSLGEDLQRGMFFWFFTTGIFIIFLGETLRYYIRKEQKPAPVFLGWALLAFSAVGCLMAPATGFWLFIPQAIIIILANRKKV